MNDDGTPDGPSAERAPRKDRLVQTRVPRDLEQTLKAEAKRQRVSVSQLVRNVLEDALELVDGVVADVDQIVSDSFTLARNVSRNAQRLADPERRQVRPDPASPSAAEAGIAVPAERENPAVGVETPAAGEAPDLSHVYGWNEVVLHRPASCVQCGGAMERGQRAYAGLSDQPSSSRAWLCARCVESIQC
jgi:hypothetical protein